MRTVGPRQEPTKHARLRESDSLYVIELDVPDFTKAELSVEALGPCITVRGDQQETESDKGKAFRIHERLEESFRLPDDADVDQIHVHYKHGVLVLRVPRLPLAPRALPIEPRPTSLLLDPDAEGV
jgi:HSP20 family molecular chaperone IbpA